MDGTMTMTVPSEARKKQTWVHLFISKGTDPFDAGRCVNFAEFTVNPGEEHLVLTDLHSLNAIMKNQLITFDPSLSRLRLCYQIQVNQPDVALTVGRGTPLSLLLKAGCLLANPRSVTPQHREELIAQLFALPKKRPAPEPAKQESSSSPPKQMCVVLHL